MDHGCAGILGEIIRKEVIQHKVGMASVEDKMKKVRLRWFGM